MPKMARKLPYNLHGWAFYKIVKFVLSKKVYQELTTMFVTKVLSDPKVNPQMNKDLNPWGTRPTFPQRETMHVFDVKFSIHLPKEPGGIQVRPLLRSLMSLNDTHFFLATNCVIL